MSETELSRENVLKIVQHYLLSSPPGEFEDILAGSKTSNKNFKIKNKSLKFLKKSSIFNIPKNC